MFKRYLIIASKNDPAGVNITEQLSQFRPNPVLSGLSKDKPSFDIYTIDDEILYEENLDLEKIKKARQQDFSFQAGGGGTYGKVIF